MSSNISNWYYFAAIISILFGLFIYFKYKK